MYLQVQRASILLCCRQRGCQHRGLLLGNIAVPTSSLRRGISGYVAALRREQLLLHLATLHNHRAEALLNLQVVSGMVTVLEELAHKRPCTSPLPCVPFERCLYCGGGGQLGCQHHTALAQLALHSCN